MEVFGLMGFMVGTIGMTFGLIALAKTTQLEQKLKDAGVLKEDS